MPVDFYELGMEGEDSGPSSVGADETATPSPAPAQSAGPGGFININIPPAKGILFYGALFATGGLVLYGIGRSVGMYAVDHVAARYKHGL